MCVAIPMLVKSVDGTDAEVELGGVGRKISVMLVPGVKPGQYVIVHAGFAIETVDEDVAKESIAYFQQIAQNEDETEV
jgi:hydrogenase expression/formation protein HypC